MSRPLLITDCDEVLLHMVVPFAAWLDQVHDIDFDLSREMFMQSIRRRATGAALGRDEIWPLLDAFFTTEMHRQPAIAGAVEAIAAIGAVADIVILTNIGPDARERRAAQLRAIGIDAPVIGNRGPKGGPLAALIAERQPTVAVFVDDLGIHHDSVADLAPAVWRLHLIGEPLVAAHVAPAAGAHARIDDWVEAQRWILDRFAEGPAGLDPTPLAVLNPAL